MSESCSGSCETCGQSCSDRKQESLLAPANAHSNVRKVIAVVSGNDDVDVRDVASPRQKRS